MKIQFQHAFHWQKLSRTKVKLDTSLLGQPSSCQWLQDIDVSLSTLKYYDCCSDCFEFRLKTRQDLQAGI